MPVLPGDAAAEYISAASLEESCHGIPTFANMLRGRFKKNKNSGFHKIIGNVC